MTERDIGHGGHEEQVDLVDDDEDEQLDDGVGESGRDMSRLQVLKSLQRMVARLGVVSGCQGHSHGYETLSKIAEHPDTMSSQLLGNLMKYWSRCSAGLTGGRRTGARASFAFQACNVGYGLVAARGAEASQRQLEVRK